MSKKTDALLKKLCDPKGQIGWFGTAWPAAFGLWLLGEEGKPVLIQAARHENVETRVMALKALRLYGLGAGADVEQVCYDSILFAPPDSVYDRVAPETLSAVCADPVKWVQVLAEGLDQANSKERLRRLIGLKQFGLLVLTVTPQILAMLKDPDRYVRAAALDCFEYKGVRNDAEIAQLVAAFDDSYDSVVMNALRALRYSGTIARQAIPEILNRIARDSGPFQYNYIASLHGICPLTPDQLQQLLALSDSIARKDLLIEALAANGAGDSPFVTRRLAEKLEILEHGDDTDKWHMHLREIACMRALRPECFARAKQILLQHLCSKKAGLRAAAARGLINSDLAEPLYRFIEAVDIPTIYAALEQESNPKVIQYLMMACGSAGHVAAPCIPLLLRNLAHQSKDVRYSMIVALQNIGIASPEVIAAFKALLQNPATSQNEKFALLWAVREFGPPAQALEETVLAVARRGGKGESAWEYARYAVEALAAITDGTTSLDYFRQVMVSPNPHVRTTAAAQVYRHDPQDRACQRELEAALLSEYFGQVTTSLEAAKVIPLTTPQFFHGVRHVLFMRDGKAALNLSLAYGPLARPLLEDLRLYRTLEIRPELCALADRALAAIDA